MINHASPELVANLQDQINSLKDELKSNSEIDEHMTSEIGECLDDIADNYRLGASIPKYIWTWLERMAAGTTIADKIAALYASFYG